MVELTLVVLSVLTTPAGLRRAAGFNLHAISEVAALFLDSEAWGIQSLQVRLRKEIADRIGASRNLFHAGTVEIPIRLIQSVGDAVVLSVPVDGLRQVLPGAPRAALLAAAADAQLLVVGARGRGGFDEMSLGSIAQAMLLYAPGPVAIVR